MKNSLFLFTLVLVLVLGGCSTVVVENECSYVREVKVTYQCTAPGGKVGHHKVTIPE